jgi:hypothetical protein
MDGIVGRDQPAGPIAMGLFSRRLRCFFACMLAACAPATVPAPVITPLALPSVLPGEGPAPSPDPVEGMSILLRPVASPLRIVHVELDLGVSARAGLETWHLTRGLASRIANAAARDGTGDMTVTSTPKGDGVNLTLSRAPSGPIHLAYDLVALGDAPDDPLGVLVADDRFRGSGGAIVALPESLVGESMPVRVRIDGSAISASGAASSFGVGNTRKLTMPLGGVLYASFLAGSLGGQVMDDPGAGHDEAAWLGYTAFDPRTTSAELAQIRSALHELFKEQPGDPFTYLLVSQTRPVGSFSTTPRWTSTLLQVGPAEPWSPALRLSMTQQLARRWVGGQLSVATSSGLESEALWFSDGVARYVATAVLVRLGLLPPEDLRQAIAGELSVLATSAYRSFDNVKLAKLTTSDPVARATLMARGALYALRESAELRARTKGEKGLDTILLELRKRAEGSKARSFSVTDWLEALGHDDPTAAATFEALVVRGDALALPANALGPCFRPATGEYVAYDAGFDVDATRMSSDGKVVGLRPGGPAAKAGLVAGDEVASMQTRDGDSDAPVKLDVVRAGKKVTLSYAPRGARGRGQTWARVPGLRDAQCGELP